MGAKQLLPLIFVLLAMVFALIALMFKLYWLSYVKKKNKALWKKVHKQGWWGKKFIHPGIFFEYCVSKDKMDDNKSAFYKEMYIISFMAWFLFFLITFVIYLVWR